MASIYRCHCGQLAYGEGASCSGESRVIVEDYVDATSPEGEDRARVRGLAFGLIADLGADAAARHNLETVMDWIREVESDAEERGRQDAIDNYEPEPPEPEDC